jgi:tripartite-type tricarboxylate transporter receptor subunit TctC
MIASGFLILPGIVLATICNAVAQTQGAASYPTRPLRLITGFLPRGVSDIVARVTGEKLGELLGQRVKDKLAYHGVETQPASRAEFATLITQDAARWKKLVAATGIALE